MNDKTSISRRSVLLGATALAACGFMTSAETEAFASDASADKDEAATADDQQYGFLVRTSRCTHCLQCVEACRKANGTPDTMESRRSVRLYETASHEEVYLSTSCMHCEKPACAEVCPAKAITKGAGGIVKVDHERCIGCKYCYQACPFGVPHYGPMGMDKCDACLEAGKKLGETPNCVSACHYRALHYGPLDELMAGSGGRAQRIECETMPSYLIQ